MKDERRAGKDSDLYNLTGMTGSPRYMALQVRVISFNFLGKEKVASPTNNFASLFFNRGC